MQRPKRRTGIVVADGVKAKVLRWDSETDMLQEFVATSIEDLAGAPPATAAVCNDQAPSPFARAVSHMIEAHREVGGLVRLIFVAPGPVLDDLAAGIPASLKKIVVGELEKDMMSASSTTIREALRSI